MLPAFSSRHLGAGTVPSLPPSLPLRVSLLHGGRGGRGLKNPGSFNSVPAAPAPLGARERLPRAGGPRHALPPGSPGGMATRRGAPGAQEAARALLAGHQVAASAQRKSSRGGQAAAPPTARGPASPAPRAPHHSPARAPAGEESAPSLGGGPAVHAAPHPARALPLGPQSAKFNFAGSWPRGACGLGDPRRDREQPARSPAPLSPWASPGAPCGREVSVTPPAGREGVRPGACPRPHPPPSRGSPRAGPRARQCARAALPSTAGGGREPGGGARRCPQAAPRPVRLGALRLQLRPALASGGWGRWGGCRDLRVPPGPARGPSAGGLPRSRVERRRRS